MMTDEQFKEIQRLKQIITMHESKLSVSKNRIQKMVQKNALQQYRLELLNLQNKANQD